MKLLRLAIGGVAALCLLICAAAPVVAPTPAAAQNCTTGAPVSYDAQAQTDLLANLCALQAGKSYRLATNQTISSGGATTPVTNVAAGSYLIAVTATSWAGTIKLQTLGPDGTSWLDVTGASWTANNTIGVVVGANASIRLFAQGGSPSGVNAVGS